MPDIVSDEKMAKVAAELYVADYEALPYEDDTFDRNQSLRNMPFRDKPDCREQQHGTQTGVE